MDTQAQPIQDNSYIEEQVYDEPTQGMYAYPPLQNPMVGSISVNQDSNFMKWLFSFRKEVVSPLRMIWQGYHYDMSKEAWVKERINFPLMNEKGISWAITLIESYINPVFVVSNMDEEKMNHLMRSVIRDIWNNLCARYKEFGIHKLDIPRVANEIESKILAILMGARGDGFRNFFSKQYHVSEVHSNQTGNNQQQQSSGFLSGVKNLFKPRYMEQQYN